MRCYSGEMRETEMTEASLEMVQAMLQRVLDIVRRHDTEFVDVKQRLGDLQIGVAGCRRDIAQTGETIAHMQVQIDQMNDRLGRVERRLELREA